MKPTSRATPPPETLPAPARAAASVPTPTAPPRVRLLAVLLLVVLAASVYLNTIPGQFVFDDYDRIVDNPHIGDWSYVPHLFRSAWRPLKRLTLMVDYHFWGLDPRGYHVTNIVFHVLATLALAGAVRALGGGDRVAFLAALLFAVHPVHTESVAVITHRKEMMGTLFLLLALGAHVRRKPSWRSATIVYPLFAASLLSKEILGAAVPLVLFTWDALFRRGGWRSNVARSIRFFLPLAGTVVVFLLFRLIYQEKFSLFPFFDPRWIREITNGQLETYPPVLGSTLRAFWVNVRLLVFPVGLSADHPFVYSHGFLEGWVMTALEALALYLGFALWLVRRRPLIAFGLLWVPVTLLPAMNVVPLTPWFIAERFLYLPSVGICIAIAAALVDLERLEVLGAGRSRWLATALAGAIVLWWMPITHARNHDWRSDAAVWAKTLEQNPDSVLAHGAIANIAYSEGRLADASIEYEEVLARAPAHRQALLNSGQGLLELGHFDEALALLESGVRYYPKDGKMHNNLGNGYKKKGRVEEALAEYRLAFELRPELPEPLINIGAYYAKKADPKSLEQAAENFELALSLDPSSAVAHFNLGLVRMMQGDKAAARDHLKRVLALEPPGSLRAQAMEKLQDLARR